MATPMLPSLYEDGKIAIAEHGKWVSNAQNTLPALVTSLKTVANNDSEICSIPDVWARPILYEAVLRDSKHPLHEKYIGEWRGILAMLALRKIRGIDDIECKSVVIPDLASIDDSTPDFLKILAKSIPSKFLDKEQDRTLSTGQIAKIQILVYNKVPIAFLWPSIYFCPSISLDKKRQREIPWWKETGILDPISELSVDEMNLLVVWLQNLINETSEDYLISLIVNYKDDLIKALGNSYKENTKLDASKGNLNITGVCSVLDSPIVAKLDADAEINSQVMLMDYVKKVNSKKKLFIISRDIEKQWNENPNDITLCGYVTVGSVLAQNIGVPIDKNMAGDINLKPLNAEIRMADDFFTDTIGVVFLGNKAFPNTINHQTYTFKDQLVNIILPIKSELLDYLDTKYIADNTEISVNNDTIEVTITLPVTGKGRNDLITATRIYRQDKMQDGMEDKFKGVVTGNIIEYDTVPLLQVWPNFILSDQNRWKAYFTYYDCCDKTTFYAVPYWEGADPKNVRKIYRDRQDAEIRRGTQFPDAFICYEPTEDKFGQRRSAKLARHEKEIEIGILPLKKPEKKALNTNNSSTYKIGVDFGTTNTVTYMNDGMSEAKAVAIEPRMFEVCNNEEGGINISGKDTLRKNFLSPFRQPHNYNPDTYDNASIKTMFHTHYGEFDGDINQTLFSGNIYYLDDSDNISDDSEISQSIHTNDMKWETGLTNMQGFIMQLLVQSMAEVILAGAGKIEISYSYPKSFTPERKRLFGNVWKNIIKNELIPITSKDIINQQPKKELESDCIARYFVESMDATINRGIVCLDMGGGSTDIAIWQGDQNTIQDQTSLRFAGRHILNDYLWLKKTKGKAILNNLKNSDNNFNKQIDRLSEIRTEHEFNLQLEAFLRYYGDDILKGLPLKVGTPEVKTMVRDIAFALSGIFFYCGMIIGTLQNKGTYDNLDSLPNCYVGGNGSKLLDWASEGEFTDDDDTLSGVLKVCFVAGINQVKDLDNKRAVFDIYKTLRAKQEVAYGLVYDSASEGTNATDDIDKYIAGEEYIVKKGEKTDDGMIDAKDFLNMVQISKTCPTVFNTFLQAFNKEAKSMGYPIIEIKDNDYLNICALVNQQLIDIANKAKGEVDAIEAEPLFIIILKTVYTHLAKS